MSEKQPIINKIEKVLNKDRGSWFNLLEPLKLAKEILKEIKLPTPTVENIDISSQQPIPKKGLSISTVNENPSNNLSLESETKSASKARNNIISFVRVEPAQKPKKINLGNESIAYATQEDTGIKDGSTIFPSLNKPKKQIQGSSNIVPFRNKKNK
jgi:hypothetical protein